jgi:Protein of unknown function with HXXEE motif
MTLRGVTDRVHCWESAQLKTWTTPVRRSDVAALLVTFPVMFALHETEEVLGVRYVRASARERLIRTLKRLGAGDRSVARVQAMSSSHMLVAVSTVGTGVAAATWLAAGPQRDFRPWQAALAVFSAHAITHGAHPLLLRGYTPGSLTGTVLIPAYYGYAGRRLARLGVWDCTSKRWSLTTGTPAVLALVFTGHALAGHRPLGRPVPASRRQRSAQSQVSGGRR